MDDLENLLLAALVAMITGLFAYLAKHYFDGIREDIDSVRKDLAKVDGYLSSLQTEIRANTVEMARSRSELGAIWRWIDAPKRTSDINGEDQR